MNVVRLVGMVTAAMVLAACGSPRVKIDVRRGAVNAPAVEPRVEPLRPANARPYTVLGRTYYPMTDFEPYWEEGIASWYGREFHGRPTASGEPYDMFTLTAAHKILPIPSYARVTNLANGRQVVVRVNDRGPFVEGRVIDLSYAAAEALGRVRVAVGPAAAVGATPYTWWPAAWAVSTTRRVSEVFPAPAGPMPKASSRSLVTNSRAMFA